ncbi:glycosyl hydrolase family 28 protein [Thermophagus sp. OGC60D27]|uniref:glycosyl hydrolase family 28 protein n=1 Tax=Thermophagus sp. OGC60D27 TaxID=3458415 RepID=UPI0040377D20
MKIFCNLTLVLLSMVLFVGCNSQKPKLNIAPNPGDLSVIEGLKESDLFDMKVNGKDLFIYHGFQVSYNKYGYGKKGGSFVNFASEPGLLNMEITASEKIESYTIMPEVQHEMVNETTIRVKGDKLQKFLVTAHLEKSGENWFIVSVEEPETNVPDKNDPSVLYIEPGVHPFGRAWRPYADGIKTVYLAPGAVVQATMHTVGQDGLTLTGRGVFAQALWDNGKDVSPLKAEWMGDMMGINFRECNNLSIDGISVINCPSYQIELADCENVVVDNVKLMGFGKGNNDGIHLYGRNIELKNSFLAGSDDRVCITGLFDRERFEVTKKAELQPRLDDTDVYNLRINNIVFWGQKNGADIMLTWNGGKTCRDVIVENVHSLGFTNKGFLATKHGGSVTVEDVTVRNAHLYHHRLIDLEITNAACWGQGGGSVRDILLEDITIDASSEDVSNKMLGFSSESNVDNIVFKNIKANGVHLNGLDQTSIQTNEFVYNVVFE